MYFRCVLCIENSITFIDYYQLYTVVKQCHGGWCVCVGGGHVANFTRLQNWSCF